MSDALIKSIHSTHTSLLKTNQRSTPLTDSGGIPQRLVSQLKQSRVYLSGLSSRFSEAQGGRVNGLDADCWAQARISGSWRGILVKLSAVRMRGVVSMVHRVKQHTICLGEDWRSCLQHHHGLFTHRISSDLADGARFFLITEDLLI